jgi:N,N-dimethylformamidase beta subunit-like, C-terminal/Domain of unknown function (DUF4082)/Bacterial Ig-like domain/Bacterial Ig domain
MSDDFWGNSALGGVRVRVSWPVLDLARRRPIRAVSLGAAMVLTGALLALVPGATAAHASCGNPVACENALPGTPQSVWDVAPGDGTTIAGFADSFSVNVGQPVSFKIESPATAYAVDIYRMGYYGGDGARLIASITPDITVSQNQPACNTNTATGLVDCGNWGVSATWNVPATAVSGVYFARIYRTDGTSDANQIPFVVTNNASTSDIVFMTSDETWQAYNDWGGYSVYQGKATGSPWCCTQLDPGRAVQVSYNRPFATRFDTPGGQDFFFATEDPMIRFLEKNGYDISYVSQADVAASGGAAMLEQHKMFMCVGHTEYWDAGDRANVTAARDAGVGLAFFSGNLMWWKTRWAASQYGNEADRTLITYKESLDSAQTDPTDPPTWTGNWRDPRFSPPGDGGQPENALTGQLWMVNCCSYALQVPYAYSRLRFWRHTSVASLQSGQTVTMPAETLGYEWDSDVSNGFRPAGEIDMSKTTETVSQLLLDPRSDVGTGQATNSLTLYRAASGALVFDAGSVQWAWGLDSVHDGDSNNPPSPAMQQATVNLLADMGAQPATMEPDLAPASASADHTPPMSTITSPAAGASFANGSTVTISGTATDSGGVVAGVEVSTDGGATWHPVTTMSPADTSVTWSYTWPSAGSGPVAILSRATDDSGNIEQPGPGASVTVNCPCGLFGSGYTPAVTSASDPTGYELGVKFQSSVPGWVNGVRFYKGTGNNGTHTGSLWSAAGTQLATGTFTNETASGWQTMTFANPVQVSANTTYVVSYWDPDGHYAAGGDLLDWPVSTPPLTALKSSYTQTGGGNGVYNVGGPGFPTSTYQGTSYAVGPVFDTAQPSGAPPAVSGVTPYPGSSSIPASVAPTVTFSKPVVPSTASFSMTGPGGAAVAGTTTFDSTGTVATFTPNASLAADTTYTVTMTGAQDQFGQGMSPATDSYTFTTSKATAPGQCPCSIWPDVAPSGASDANDTGAVELGVRITASGNGTISGIRFYKEPDNTGTHTGSLWTSSGTLLATGTFSSESTAGWQELDFPTPVPVTGGTTYVASYHTNAGHYAVTPGGLGTAVTSGPLTAQANGGVYAYGSTSTFPSSTFNGSNYWVDVVYQPSPPPVCPCSIWPGTAQPSVASANDPSAVELGVKFTSDSSGWITGIRFYKGTANTGTHVGSLWDASGKLLGQVTFSNESASGWQQANFASPIPVTAGTTYVASYFAPNGGYAYDSGMFAGAGVDSPPLHALASGPSGGNGVYSYAGSPTFPVNSFNAANYWVDVVFTTTAP